MAVVVAMARAALTPAPNLTYFDRQSANFMGTVVTAIRQRRHSSGTPALRRPTKKVVSDKVRIVGGSEDGLRDRIFAMLENEPSRASFQASASSTVARSVSPLSP